jgi:uncharacterized membrane protein
MEITHHWLPTLTLISALGCAIMAGVFFTFSTFVMRALARLPPAQGIAAMQSINITAINPLFMLTLFGTGVACMVLIWLSLHQTDAHFLITGSLCYLLGALVVTITKNVPLNNTLANTQANSTEGASVWAHYLKYWVFWNHVRTIAALAAAVLLICTYY